MDKVLVFTATYNEVDNIFRWSKRSWPPCPPATSWWSTTTLPTAPASSSSELRARQPRLQVIHRPGKNGLGSAHKLGMKYALENGYDALVTMDADFSHDPGCCPR